MLISMLYTTVESLCFNHRCRHTSFDCFGAMDDVKVIATEMMSLSTL